MAEAKSEGSGTSLGVQWLRLHASNAETMASIPDWGTKIPHAVWPKKKQRNEGFSFRGQQRWHGIVVGN